MTYAPLANSVNDWLDFAQKSRHWLDDSKVIFDKLEPGMNRSSEPATPELAMTVWGINEDYMHVPWNETGLFAPILHTSPPPKADGHSYQNINLFSDPNFADVSLAAINLHDSVFSKFEASTEGSAIMELAYIGQGKSIGDFGDLLHPHSVIAQPVYPDFDELAEKDVVGFVYSVIDWDSYLSVLLPQGVNGIVAVLRNACNQSFTYEVDGHAAVFLGESDLHDTVYDGMRHTVDFADMYNDSFEASQVEGHCLIYLDIYPSTIFYETFNASNIAMTFSVVVAALFFLMAGVFLLYDRMVNRRHNSVVGYATASTNLVASLYPANVMEQLLADEKEKKAQQQVHQTKGLYKMDSIEDQYSAEEGTLTSKPIAELFPAVTILFADLVGKIHQQSKPFVFFVSSCSLLLHNNTDKFFFNFGTRVHKLEQVRRNKLTTGSITKSLNFVHCTTHAVIFFHLVVYSVRSPTEVFELLETLYGAYDAIAKNRKVFKGTSDDHPTILNSLHLHISNWSILSVYSIPYYSFILS